MTAFGRVISVRGSLARVGLLSVSQIGLAEVRATVGRFVSIRCSNSTIVAMITDVSCEDLPSTDNYIATAGVDLLGEILGGAERAKFQRGVTNYPTIGDAVDLITNAELRTVYAPTGSDHLLQPMLVGSETLPLRVCTFNAVFCGSDPWRRILPNRLTCDASSTGLV